MKNSLTPLWSPSSVTVIGASANPAKLGHTFIRNILEGGYPGSLTGVNPKEQEILGVPCYPSVGDIPAPPDLAVVVVPAEPSVEVVRQCGEAGVAAVIVIAAGFAEIGGLGTEREARLRELSRKYDFRLLGPNCLGIIDPVDKLNASFAGAMPKPGHVAVLSQSGAMCTAILDWAKLTGVGFSKFVSVGNKADVTESDLLAAWAEDSQTTTVLGYLEAISNGPEFMETAARLTQRKPFVLIKAGISEAGAAAVSSHTGSLTGSEDVLAAALARAGVTRAASIEELLDFTTVFAGARLPRGSRVAVVTNAGGPGVITTDAVAEVGLEMASFDPKTEGKLEYLLPEEANVHNPVDCIGDARADRYEHALTTVLADKNVDSALVLLTPQAMTEIVETAEVIIAAAKRQDKPIIASFIGGKAVAAGIERLQAAGVAAYPTPERAVRALQALSEYAVYRRDRQVAPRKSNPHAKSLAVLHSAVARRHQAIWGSEAAELVAPYGIRAPQTLKANHAEAAVKAAKKIGYPVVLKIDSPDILHKTDAGGVALDLADESAVRAGYTEMVERITAAHPKARINGVTVTTMVPDGMDFLVGAKRDVTFGPVVVFGYGGIYVEVFKDVAFGLPPLDAGQAEDLIEQTKAAVLLAGARGQQKLDRPALIQTIVGVSRLMVDFPEIAELDLNPIRVFAKGALAIDARIILAESNPGRAPQE